MRVKSGCSGDFESAFLVAMRGDGHVSELLGRPEFVARGMEMCRSILRNNQDASYDAEDLFVDACAKVVRYEDKFARQEMLQAEHFFKWFYILASNVFRRRLRRARRLRWHGIVTPFVSVERSPPAIDSGVDLERECLLSEFVDFIARTLPPERRRAVELWLEGYTFREAEAVLNREGVSCTSYAAQRWVREGLEGFRAEGARGHAKTSGRRPNSETKKVS